MVLFSAVFLTGCPTPQEYIQSADTEAYQLIESKWTDTLGTKVNYRISDVTPGPNDIIPEAAADMVPGRPLTLARAVAIATASSRDYQAQKESLYNAALDLSDVRHQFDKIWFASFDTDYANTSSDESVSYDAGFGVSQLLADGTAVSADVAVDWLRYLTGDSRTSLGSVISATVSRPLLRGAGKDIVLENLTQSERNLLYQIRSFNRYRHTFVVSTVSAYYRVLQALDGVENSRQNYESLIRSYDEAQMLAEAGKRTRLQSDQTKQSMLQAGDRLTSTQRSYQQTLDEFKIRLALPTDTEMSLDPNELKALAEMDITEPDFSAEEAVRIALETRLDLATSANRVDDALRKIKVAEDNLGADLDIVLSASASSPSGETDIDRIQFQDGSYSAGLSLDLPLDRKSERNSYRQAIITYNQRKRDYELAVDNVKLDVRGSYRELIEAATRYRIQKESLRLSEERVNSTNMLLKAGRASARDLLEAQSDLLSSQNDTTSTLVDYIVAKLTFYSDVGILSVRPDGLWEQKSHDF